MVDIVHRIGIRARANDVYDAVSTARGVAGWWTSDTTGRASAGGEVDVRFRNVDGSEIGRMKFEIAERAPGRDVRWHFTDGPPEWIGTEATFQLTEEDGMTVLVFGHRNWKEPVEFMAHCSMKWAVFLLSLRSLLETGQGQPAPQDVKIDNWN